MHEPPRLGWSQHDGQVMVGFDLGRLPLPNVATSNILPMTREVGTQYDEEMREWKPPPEGGAYQIHPALESWLDNAGWMEKERPGLDAAHAFMRAKESYLRARDRGYPASDDSEEEEEAPLVMTVNDLADFVQWLIADRNAAKSRSRALLNHMLDMESAR